MRSEFNGCLERITPEGEKNQEKRQWCFKTLGAPGVPLKSELHNSQFEAIVNKILSFSINPKQNLTF